MLSLLPSLCISGLALVASARGDQPLQQVGHTSESVGQQIEFRPAHIFHHGTGKYPDLHRRLDTQPRAEMQPRNVAGPPSYLTASSRPMQIQRLANRSPSYIDSLLETARMVGQPVSLPASAWTVDEILGPNISDKSTVLTLARAAGNAYLSEPGQPDWRDVKGGFNYTEDFGWEGDGIRGHVFADKTNGTVIVGLKGTTVAVWDGSGTTTQDKLNDNLFFGCCCGEGSYWTKKPCSCASGTYTCNATCVAGALREKNRYYHSAQHLYRNVTELYPTANIWLAGHSLGGSVASLLGMTYGLPVVTFEAPGEAMAASRLGLPTPPGYRIGDNEPVPSSASVHFGHNADPLFLGTCGSSCYAGGYAMESVCHSGMECVYNVTGDLGWGSHLQNHGIQLVIDQVLEKYDQPAKCEVVQDCNDCYLWEYFESNSSETTTTTSSSSTYSRTRTETCKTPGWFGCLDETTTTTSTTSSSSAAVTTPATASTTSTAAPSSTTCETPGRVWGCWDKPAPGAAAFRMIPSATATEAFGPWYAHELADGLR